MKPLGFVGSGVRTGKSNAAGRRIATLTETRVIRFSRSCRFASSAERNATARELAERRHERTPPSKGPGAPSPVYTGDRCHTARFLTHTLTPPLNAIEILVGRLDIRIHGVLQRRSRPEVREEFVKVFRYVLAVS